MPDVVRTTIALPGPASGAVARPAIFDADLDTQGNALFAFGTDQAATHLIFSSGALVKLRTPVYRCRARLLAPDEALVWGAMRPPYDEPNSWIVRSTGSIGQAFSAVQYCADAFCTGSYIVLTYWDEQIAGGDDVASEGLAVFDRTGRFLWGWNSTISQAAPINDCDAAVRIGPDRIGVFADVEYPLVVLDLTSRRPVAVYHPTPGVLHGAQAISLREERWYFANPYRAKEAILRWKPRGGDPETVGHVSARSGIRGLEGGRFIAVARDHVDVLAIR
jgi:hypothetical protein